MNEIKDSLDLIGEEEAEMFQVKIAHQQRLGDVEPDVYGERGTSLDGFIVSYVVGMGRG